MSPDALTALGTAASAVHVAVGLLFLSAAVKKVLHWQEFCGVVTAYQLVPASGAAAMAAIAVVLESLLGAACFFDQAMPLTSIGAAAMLIAFAAAMAINLWRGRAAIDCGCFQTALRQPLEWRLVARNLVCALMVLAAGLTPAVPDLNVWLLALPAGAALFSLYMALNGVWALDASRRVAFGRS
jgi:hypothetical protein